MAESWVERNETMVLAVIAIAVGAVTLLVMWLWRERDKQSKTLDYQVIDDLPVFAGHDRPKHLKVTYRETIDVTDPRVTRILFKNTGRKRIEEDDVSEPYFIERGSAQLLDKDLIDQSLSSTRAGPAAEIELIADDPEFPTKFTSARVIPKKLNPGHWFTIQLIFDGGGNNPITVSGELKDETRPTRLIDTEKELNRRNGLYIAIVAVALFLSGWILHVSSAANTVGDKIAIGCFYVGFGLSLLAYSRIFPSDKKVDKEKG